MQVAELLYDTLNDMGQQDFEDFRWFLSQPILDSCNPIPWGIIEKLNRREVVAKIISRYNDEAVKVTIEVLKKQKINNIAEGLKNRYEAGLRAASSSTTPAAATPATAATAGPSVLAQGASVIIAPAFSNGSTVGGNLTINVTTPNQR